VVEQVEPAAGWWAPYLMVGPERADRG